MATILELTYLDRSSDRPECRLAVPFRSVVSRELLRTETWDVTWLGRTARPSGKLRSTT